ncbi:MAG TPA: hypothetical protein VJ753_01205 [Rhizomicrobium sp.]|nr:hypothetical protein [Rhizomicrobium sp.]
MKKIPVGTAIAHAYRFAFGDFLTVLRSIWLPLCVQLGLTIILARHAIPLVRALEAKDPSAPSLLGPLLLLYPVVLILFFAQFTVVTKVALGTRREIPLIDFPFGKDMWRLLGAFIVAGLAIVAMLIAFALATGVLSFLLSAMGIGKTMLAILIGLLFAIGYGGTIFVIFRFLFLLAPVNIAEQHLGIGRAWQLSQGNFWRSFLIALAILLPMIVVEYAVIFAAIGLPPMPHGEGPQAFEARRMEWNIAILQAMVTHWYIALPLFTLFMVVYLGAICGAQAFAYRKLTEDEISTPVAAD